MNCRQIWAMSLCEERDCFRLRGHTGLCGWIAIPPPPPPEPAA